MNYLPINKLPFKRRRISLKGKFVYVVAVRIYADVKQVNTFNDITENTKTSALFDKCWRYISCDSYLWKGTIKQCRCKRLRWLVMNSEVGCRFPDQAKTKWRCKDIKVACPFKRTNLGRRITWLWIIKIWRGSIWLEAEWKIRMTVLW